MHLANNIESFIKNKSLKTFNYKIRGYFLALSGYKTVAQAFFLVFDGMLGRLVRDLYYKYIFGKLVKK